MLLTASVMGIPVFATGPAATAHAADPAVTAHPADSAESSAQYAVQDAGTPAQRDQIARTGAVIDDVQRSVVTVTATPGEVRHLHAREFATAASTLEFPPVDAAYHDYAEMVADVDAVVARYPAIAAKRIIWHTYQGRDIIAVKFS